MKFLNDYDQFEVGETWYLTKKEEIYVKDGDSEKLMSFEEDAELEIKSISKESGYGYAIVTINGYETKLSLDELYDMVFD